MEGMLFTFNPLKINKWANAVGITCISVCCWGLNKGLMHASQLCTMELFTSPRILILSVNCLYKLVAHYLSSKLFFLS